MEGEWGQDVLVGGQLPNSCRWWGRWSRGQGLRSGSRWGCWEASGRSQPVSASVSSSVKWDYDSSPGRLEERLKRGAAWSDPHPSRSGLRHLCSLPVSEPGPGCQDGAPRLHTQGHRSRQALSHVARLQPTPSSQGGWTHPGQQPRTPGQCLPQQESPGGSLGVTEAGVSGVLPAGEGSQGAPCPSFVLRQVPSLAPCVCHLAPSGTLP